MEKIVVFNANNEPMQVEIVRYFSESNNKYFIFSLHELDGQGHMNIYVTKIVDQNGNLIGTNIIDDVEWSNLKSNLQRIIKENRTSGNAIVNDLPCNLQNLKIFDRRALKLFATSVDMLNMGYKNESDISVSEPTTNNVIDTHIQATETMSNNNINNIQNEQNRPVQNDIGIFNGNLNANQSNPEHINTVNNNQNASINNVETNNNPNTSINNVETNNQIKSTDNFEQLYFLEKNKNEQLIQENNKLITELNNYKVMIQDIKNVLSR